MVINISQILPFFKISRTRAFKMTTFSWFRAPHWENAPFSRKWVRAWYTFWSGVGGPGFFFGVRRLRWLQRPFLMMKSSNGNLFRVTSHLCGELTGHQWIPRTKASDAELRCVLWSARFVHSKIISLIQIPAAKICISVNWYCFVSMADVPRVKYINGRIPTDTVNKYGQEMSEIRHGWSIASLCFLWEWLLIHAVTWMMV